MTLAVTKKQPNKERLWPSSLQYHICPHLHAAFKNAATSETRDPFSPPNQAKSASCCKKNNAMHLLDPVSLSYSFLKINSCQRSEREKQFIMTLPGSTAIGLKLTFNPIFRDS